MMRKRRKEGEEEGFKEVKGHELVDEYDGIQDLSSSCYFN